MYAYENTWPISSPTNNWATTQPVFSDTIVVTSWSRENAWTPHDRLAALRNAIRDPDSLLKYHLALPYVRYFQLDLIEKPQIVLPPRPPTIRLHTFPWLHSVMRQRRPVRSRPGYRLKRR